MDNSKGIILWIGGFSGLLLLYAAYKGESPLALFQNHVNAANTSTTNTAPSGVGSGPGNSGHPGNNTVTDSNSATSVGQQDGSYVVTDAYGNEIGVIPTAYQGSPNSYIPSGVTG